MRRRPLATLVGLMAGLAPIGALVSVSALALGGPGVTAAGTAATLVHPPVSVLSVQRDAVTSTNWSGYAVGATSAFSDVIGSWVQPAATCSFLQPTYGSFWVGLDGYTSSSVEQLGTDADCSWNGTPSYYAWWEMYPAGSVTLSSSTYPVKPGDTLTAEVKPSGAGYALSLHSSEGWTFSTAQPGSFANSSAEWVAEAPLVCTFVLCHGAKLTNFGQVTFAGSTAATGGASAPISSFTANGGPHQITMDSQLGVTRAQPGPLTPAGTGFTDVFKSS